MKQKITVLLALILCFSVLIVPNVQARTLTSNETGNHGGYDYEYWKDSGNGTMVLKDGGTFSCQWSNINNILFRKGRKYDETKTHQQLGNIVVEYGADFRPNGNSYLCVYGWTVDPLVEYYIIESWGDWRPPGAQSKGKITVDGGTYDVYETTRVNQPSIKGTATFQQYWSVRTSKKTSGTISVSQHFRAWENMGMKMGKMYEVATTVEGYQSSGSADVYKNDIKVGGSIPNDPVDPVDPGDPGGSTMPENNGPNSRDAFSTIEAEEYNAYSSSTMEIIGTGSGEGIGYIENGDSLTFKNVNFGSGATKFTANVASDVENPTTIDIRLGSSTGTRIGTLEVGSTGGWNDYTELSTNISSVTGENDIVLVFSGAVNIDWFTFTKGSGGTNPTTPPTHNPNVKYGDVNDDGVVNSMDASLLSRYVLEIIDSLPNIDAADLNGDKTINSMDSTLLSRYILEVIDKFPVEDMIPVPTQTPTKTPEPTIKPNSKLVALTFDDGPDNQLTARVLDKLDLYDVPATFFMIGQKINGSTASIVKRVVDSGHEIGNHSWGYDSLNNKSANEIRKSVEDTNAAIMQYAGVKPNFFRPPNLATSNTMFQNIDLVFAGGITANDWDQSTSAQQRASMILNSVRDGSIILLHDVQPLPHPTAEALDIIIPELKRQGYEFVTLTDLFKLKGVPITPSNKMYTSVP
jgi:peptidoglycan/xylan/chitin deacetylase (PgdA/CDA1 family)